MSALALRAVTDVRPTIASVVESEERTAQAYDAAVLRFRSGRATSRELGQIIDTTIVGEIERMRERVRALTDVPPADAPLVTDTLAYLQLRAEGWRMRAVALRKSSMRGLIEADKADRAALEIFARVRSAIAK